MTAYYNEHDPFAAAWLRNLIGENLIAPGVVDERSISDVQPRDLKEFTQCHFFAGIGGWSYALRMAGWPDDRPVWTGSCPCQPFSAAGQRRGTADERHLWPDFCALIFECGPSTVFGEQVASKDGREWFSRVRTDLEALDYAVGAADLCAACVGAPHIRQRLFWLAHHQRLEGGDARAMGRQRAAAERSGEAGWMAYANGRDAGAQREQRSGEQRQFAHNGGPGRLADGKGDGKGDGREQWRTEPDGRLIVSGGGLVNPSSEQARLSRRPWIDRDTIECTDGKARPVEPGTFPLAHGFPNRVGTLRGYGNAIIPQAAAEFIIAYEEAILFL